MGLACNMAFSAECLAQNENTKELLSQHQIVFRNTKLCETIRPLFRKEPRMPINILNSKIETVGASNVTY